MWFSRSIRAKRVEWVSDPSIAVARDVCLALNYVPTDKALPLLVQLADRYDGKDRWYLEALGIGATGREEEFLDAWKRDGKAHYLPLQPRV